MKEKLWNKNFLLLLQGNAVSTLGDLMYSVAIGYWVYQKTGSSGLMGVMSSISMFVMMILSPFCGSIVDKCNRKWLMVGIDVTQGVLMLTVGVLAYMDVLSVSGVLTVAFLAALGSVFYSPTISTIMLDIIPRKDMVRGQSVHSGVNSFINLFGSAFSGAMVAFFGVPLIVCINGISNIYSAVSEMFIIVPKTISQGEKVTPSSIARDMVEAVRSIFTDGCLKIFVPSALVLNLLGAGPFALLLPFCIQKGFDVDTYGYLISIYTVASLVGVTILGIVKFSPKTRFWIMAFGFSTSVIFSILAFLSGSFVMIAVMSFLAGITNCAGNTVFNASLMLALPEKNRSSILGFIQSASVGGTALSTVIYGFLGDFFPLYIVFVMGTAISLVPMLYLCFHPQTKRFVVENDDSSNNIKESE